MGNVIFVPGLQGVNHITENANRVGQIPRGSNEEAVYEAAKNAGWAFHKVAYQTANDPAPLLSAMEEKTAEQISQIFDLTRGPHIVVGSSVGFGVTVGAISRMKSTTSSFGLIGFKSIPDPLMAIEFQLKSQNALDALQVGLIPEIRMPVEGAGKDFFPLTKDHINDPEAMRLLSAPGAILQFKQAAGNKVKDCKLVFARQDHLTRAFLLADWKNIIPCHHTRTIVRRGDHSTDLGPVLGREVSAMIARLG